MLNRWPVCGSWVNLLSRDQLLHLVSSCQFGRPFIFANHNLHSLHLVQTDTEMQRFYSGASAIHVDGMPIVALTRVLGAPAWPRHRHTSADFLLPFLARLRENGKRVFIVGGKQEVLVPFLNLMADRLPGLCLDGHHGYLHHDEAASRAACAAINGFKPDLLLLGMGMPLQERWYIKHQAVLPPCMVMNLGAFMDYWVGAKSMPPRALAACGLEWAWRLGSEPRRLWRRYLVEPLLLAVPFALHRRRVRW